MYRSHCPRFHTWCPRKAQNFLFLGNSWSSGMFLGVVDENSCITTFLSFRFFFHKVRTVSAMVISQNTDGKRNGMWESLVNQSLFTGEGTFSPESPWHVCLPPGPVCLPRAVRQSLTHPVQCAVSPKTQCSASRAFFPNVCVTLAWKLYLHSTPIHTIQCIKRLQYANQCEPQWVSDTFSTSTERCMGMRNIPLGAMVSPGGWEGSDWVLHRISKASQEPSPQAGQEIHNRSLYYPLYCSAVSQIIPDKLSKHTPPKSH